MYIYDIKLLLMYDLLNIQFVHDGICSFYLTKIRTDSSISIIRGRQTDRQTSRLTSARPADINKPHPLFSPCRPLWELSLPRPFDMFLYSRFPRAGISSLVPAVTPFALRSLSDRKIHSLSVLSCWRVSILAIVRHVC